LARIEAQKLAAIAEAQERMEQRGPEGITPGLAEEASVSGLDPPSARSAHSHEARIAEQKVRPRQLKRAAGRPGDSKGPCASDSGSG
jgi:hypothetical protein